MAWQYHEPGEPVPLNVSDGETVYHAQVWWDELTEPLDAEVAARDVDHARERCLEMFSKIAGRAPPDRIDVWSLEEWVQYWTHP